jgi:hypothetical protein
MSRGRQRLGGLGLFLLGAAMTAWEWKTALIDGYYHPKAASARAARCSSACVSVAMFDRIT